MGFPFSMFGEFNHPVNLGQEAEPERSPGTVLHSPPLSILYPGCLHGKLVEPEGWGTMPSNEAGESPAWRPSFLACTVCGSR